MLYTKKFVFTVSLCAMLAVNPVLAVTNPVEAKAAAKSGTPGVVSTVYSDWAGRATSGIAGVSYVNSAVDAAGNAAQWAENHAAVAAQNAASAAKSASDAADSASDAEKVLQKAVLRPDDVVEKGEPVGSVTLPVYVKADGTVATITSYQGKAATAGTADKAKADINGAQIDTTYEKLSNKVTTLSATSTDTQYPSAKAVYTELGKKQAALGYTAENAGNKVTALSATSTNTQYPGAKLVYDELSKKENTANKVTALSADSTDTQYPSAKAVYTELGKKQSSLGYTAENTANKVTTLSANSTDTQYPSAKAVYTELGKKQSSLGYTAENTANKVTTLSANSTDTQYPSAKAVYTELGKKQAALGYTAENAGNKVTALSATSTNTQYPGAKLVYDELAKKVDKDQGVDNKNLAMVTNNAGSVYAGYVAPSMIADGGKIDNSNINSYSGFVLWSDHDGNVSWKRVDDEFLASGAVTAAKIADGAVTAAKIANGAVTAAKIANGAVTAEKIAAGSGVTVGDVLLTKSGSSGLYTVWGQVGSAGIADAAVTTNKISGFAVTAGKIAEGAVMEYTIAEGAVTTDKIANGAVTADKIAAGAVTASKFDALGMGQYAGQALVSFEGLLTGVGWGQVGSAGIANGAVTIDKTAGVVGMVPVGSADATTYSQMWIE